MTTGPLVDSSGHSFPSVLFSCSSLLFLFGFTFLIFIRNNHNTRGLTLGATDPHLRLGVTRLVYVMVAVPTIRNSPHTQHPVPGANLHDLT